MIYVEVNQASVVYMLCAIGFQYLVYNEDHIKGSYEGTHIKSYVQAQ